MNPMKSKILEDSNLDSRTLDSNLHSELGHLSHIACLSILSLVTSVTLLAYLPEKLSTEPKLLGLQ